MGHKNAPPTVYLRQGQIQTLQILILCLVNDYRNYLSQYISSNKILVSHMLVKILSLSHALNIHPPLAQVDI